MFLLFALRQFSCYFVRFCSLVLCFAYSLFAFSVVFRTWNLFLHDVGVGVCCFLLCIKKNKNSKFIAIMPNPTTATTTSCTTATATRRDDDGDEDGDRVEEEKEEDEHAQQAKSSSSTKTTNCNSLLHTHTHEFTLLNDENSAHLFSRIHIHNLQTFVVVSQWQGALC